MKSFKKCISLAVVFLSLFLAGCNNNHTIEDFHGQQFPISVYDDIAIVDGFLYSGAFPEDAEFEEKDNVFALKVKNDSVKHLQYAKIYVTTDQKEMIFEISTLPVNETVVVMEKNAQTLAEDEKIISVRGENRVDFEKAFSLHLDTFDITVNNGVFNIKNITDKDIPTNIYVYYKKKDADGNYFGGITFRSKTDGLKAGEFKQMPASNFNPEDSEVIFVDYASE